MNSNNMIAGTFILIASAALMSLYFFLTNDLGFSQSLLNDVYKMTLLAIQIVFFLLTPLLLFFLVETPLKAFWPSYLFFLVVMPSIPVIEYLTMHPFQMHFSALWVDPSAEIPLLIFLGCLTLQMLSWKKFNN